MYLCPSSSAFFFFPQPKRTFVDVFLVLTSPPSARRPGQNDGSVDFDLWLFRLFVAETGTPDKRGVGFRRLYLRRSLTQSIGLASWLGRLSRVIVLRRVRVFYVEWGEVSAQFASIYCRQASCCVEISCPFWHIGLVRFVWSKINTTYVDFILSHDVFGTWKAFCVGCFFFFAGGEGGVRWTLFFVALALFS